MSGRVTGPCHLWALVFRILLAGRLFLDDPLEKGELSAAVVLPPPWQPIQTDAFGHTPSIAH
eukprot:scaffold235371_cov70-Cyclotella_meneghiniana.AAC.1